MATAKPRPDGPSYTTASPPTTGPQQAPQKLHDRLPGVAVNNNMSASLQSGVPAQAGSTAHRPLTAADVLSAREVAELLHMPTSTVEHLARQGTLPSRKTGRRRLFVRQHVEAVLLGEAAETVPEDG